MLRLGQRRSWGKKKKKYLTHWFLSLILISCVLIIGFLYISKPYNMDPDTRPTLLLNSQLSQAKWAHMRLNFWFESGKPEADIFDSLPREGWEWREISYQSPTGATAFQLTGYKRIVAAEEEELLDWFREVSLAVSRCGGVAYLDERIEEEIDIARYCAHYNVEPRQWALTSNTLSIAGKTLGDNPAVHAGKDTINIQLLSKRSPESSKGMTALTLPVLLEAI